MPESDGTAACGFMLMEKFTVCVDGFSLCTKGSQRGKETAVKWKRSNAASVVKCVCAPLRICIISPDRERRVCVEGKALNNSVCKDLFSLGRRKGTLTNINGIPEYFKSYPHYLLFHL